LICEMFYIHDTKMGCRSVLIGSLMTTMLNSSDGDETAYAESESRTSLSRVESLCLSAVVSILIFLGQTVHVCQSYNAGLWSPPQRACTEKSKLNMI